MLDITVLDGIAIVGLTATAVKNVKIARTVCTIGACCSAAAILHITIMNSDIHSWLSNSMKTAGTDLKDNPLRRISGELRHAHDKCLPS
jgi:hypothetical protein